MAKKSVAALVIAPGERIEWRCDSFSDLTPAHFDQLAELGAELVLFGSGQRLRFPQRPGLLAWSAGASAWKPWTPQPPAAPTISWLRGPPCVVALLLKPLRKKL